MFQTSKTQLFYLSALGVWGLWGYAFFNGMFARLETVTSTLRFPDDRPLRSSYTGLAAVDAQLTLLSAFYDVLTNARTSGPRLLFFDINYAVACANLWVLIESRRRSVRSLLLRYPAWALVLCNANGAAIILPLYLYAVCSSKARVRDASMPWHEAAAFPLTTLVILLQPLLVFAPAWSGNGGSSLHHGCIALFQVAPILVMASHLSLVAILPRKYTGTTQSSVKEGRKWVVASLILAGIVASAVHFYTSVGSLLTQDTDASLLRLFLPARGFEDPYESLMKKEVTSVEYAALLENLHLFSQWDWIVVCLTTIVFAHLLLSRKDGVEKMKSKGTSSPNEFQELIYLTIATVVLGPGAAGSFALAIREARI